MVKFRRARIWSCLAASLACLVGLRSTADAQVAKGVDVVQEEVAQPKAGVNLTDDPDVVPDEPEVAPGGQVGQVVRFQMTDDIFDQWVFGNDFNGRRGSGGRSKLDNMLNLQVDSLAKACTLTESQRKKLLLAGRGDLRGFLERVEEKRQQFQKVKNDQNKANEFYQQVWPLQMMLRSGLFQDGSFFAKTLRRTLGAEQAAEYARLDRERKLYRYRAKVELVVTMLDQSVGLTDSQRSRLLELILAETKVPTKFGMYDYYLVMYKASKLPQARLRTVVTAAQWPAFNRAFDQVRGLEQFLKSNGYIPEEEVAQEPPKRMPGVRRRRAEAAQQPQARAAAPVAIGGQLRGVVINVVPRALPAPPVGLPADVFAAP